MLVAVWLVRESLPALRDVGLGAFLTDGAWHPREGQWGMAPMIAGSLAVTLGALGIAIPTGIAVAIFNCYFVSGAVAGWTRRMLEVLAGVPSVVYGFWGLVALAPVIARVRQPGTAVITGALVVALMILPTAAVATEAALRAVPRDTVRGALSLGLSRWSVAWQVALPAARSGVRTGALLAAGRAVGETMAVMMVCGNVVAVPKSLFDPVRTLTANIALEMAYAMGTHRAALFVSGLLLLAVVAALALLAGGPTPGRSQG